MTSAQRGLQSNQAFLVKKASIDAFDFMVVVFLNIGSFFNGKDGSDGAKTRSQRGSEFRGRREPRAEARRPPTRAAPGRSGPGGAPWWSDDSASRGLARPPRSGAPR
jgi:hypothetical protein